MEGKLFSAVAEARRVSADHELDRPPIGVEDLCKALGIRIRYVDFSSIEGKVGKWISSAIQKRGEDYAILVNEDAHDVQARFAIAHELGHYFFHMRDDPRQIVASFRGDRSPREATANKFAAELLMPKELVKAEYSKMVIPVSDTLARRFDVSKAAMRDRLDGLGLMHI